MRMTVKAISILVAGTLLAISLTAVSGRLPLRMTWDITSFVSSLTYHGKTSRLQYPADSDISGQISLLEGVGASVPGIQFKNGDLQHIDLAKEAGFRLIRKGLYWSYVEKVEGQYDFKQFDELVQQANARGMIVNVTLFSNNPLYEQTNGDDAAIITEKGRQGFAKFAAAAAARYADDEVVFEIWNEPNLRNFWRAHPTDPDNSNIDAMADEYAALVKVVVPAMKEANPDVFVSAGSISALWRKSFSWFDRTIQQGILESGIDAISVHPYGFGWPEQAEIAGYSVLRQKLEAAGRGNIGIVNTEVGFPADNWITDRGYSREEALKLQGALLIRQQLLDSLYGIRFSVWYEFRSSDTYGLVDTDFKLRPAYAAAKTMYDELDGYRLLGREATQKQQDFVLLFSNGTKNKVVAWTSPPPFRKKAVPHVIKTDFEILRIVDTFGREISAGTHSLELSEYPKFVEIKPAANDDGHSLQASGD